MTSTSLNISSEYRDFSEYPIPGEFEINFDRDYKNVSEIKLTNIEIPHTQMLVTRPLLVISECQDGEWIPFELANSSGNYVITDLMNSLAAGSLAMRTIGDYRKVPYNEYRFVADTLWGKMAIVSDGNALFRVHSRSDPVKITSVSVADDGERLKLAIHDHTGWPLAPGCPGRLIMSPSFESRLVVVDSITNATIFVRAARGGSKAFSSDIFVNKVAGDTIDDLLPDARFEPYEYGSVETPLNHVLGFDQKQDNGSLGNSYEARSIQNPFTRDYDIDDLSIGRCRISFELPVFCTTSDYLEIDGTGSFIDGMQCPVVAVYDATHVDISIDRDTLFEADPDDSGAKIIVDGVEHVANGFTITSVSNLVVGVTVSVPTIADSSVYTPGTSTVEFSGMIHPEFEIGLSPTLEAVTASSFDILIAYPHSAYGGRALPMGSNLALDEDLVLRRLENTRLADGRFDFSRAQRFVYLYLELNGVAVGNNRLASIPNLPLLARIPLNKGVSSLTYLGEAELGQVVKFASALGSVSRAKVVVYRQNGTVYDFRLVDFSITLAVTET